jgi:DNA-binding phage protein
MVKISDLPRWDAAEVLKTPEAQAEYIALALADGDAEEIRLAYETVARARRMHGGRDAAPQSGERSTRQRD